MSFLVIRQGKRDAVNIMTLICRAIKVLFNEFKKISVLFWRHPQKSVFVKIS